MRRVIITYGLISGAIVSGLMLASMPFWENGVLNFDNGEVVGYTTMVISLSLVFFGIKSCRDYVYHGSITFWQGFKVGILITLIASFMYAVTWEICYHTIASDFTEKMAQHYVDKARNDGKTAEEVAVVVEQMESMNEWYKNPALRFVITLTEILPVGIVITIICALLLRNREVLPVDPNATG